MKPEDLMLGNYLHDKLTGELLEVSVLTKKHIHTRLLDQTKYPLPDGWQATYIPITPDWLNLFEMGMMYEIKVRRNEGTKTWDYYCRNSFIKRIQYIHELQNIHFLITNKRLTLTK